MFVIQSWSGLLRPGAVEDGPPYPPPGMWSTIARCGTIDQAEQGLRRILNPSFGPHRSPDQYRITDERVALREAAAARRKRKLPVAA